MITGDKLISANTLIATIVETESKVALSAPYDVEWFVQNWNCLWDK